MHAGPRLASVGRGSAYFARELGAGVLDGMAGGAVMAEAVPAAGAPRVSRLDRRKARTRQALIDAAVRLIAEGRGDRASIAEITEEADIGFGSFYNHFDSKAERFAVGMRISGRLGWTHPDIAGFLTGMGLGALDIPGGLAPRALRDIQA